MEAHIIILGLLLATSNFVHCEEEAVSHNITTVPANLIKVKVQDQVEVVCSTPLEGVSTYWMTFNGTTITQLNSSLISDSNGTLLIPHIDFELDGIYNCSTSDDKFTMFVTIEAYIMPSYFREGMIILAVAGGLVILFFLCLLHQTVRNRRDMKKGGYNSKPLPT